MTEKFSGFSQEEINKIYANSKAKRPILNPTTYTLKPTVTRGHSGIRRMPDKVETNRKLCQQLQQQKPQQQQQQQHNIAKGSTTAKSKVSLNNRTTQHKTKCSALDNEIVEESFVDSTMSKSIEEALFYQPFKKVEDEQRHNDSSILRVSLTAESHALSNSNINSMDKSSLLYPTEALSTQTLEQNTTNQQTGVEDVCEPIVSSDSPFKGISLKDFEKHRQFIEEQNRQKKDLLYKTIEHQSQKTAAEARKIEEIKAELSKLDNELAIDVALLRKQIDTACIHFSNIEKQYVKIETQFLKAKIDLHKAAEKKELLTEHLYTVIAHNEDRKAKKLSELMERVGLTAQLSNEYTAPTPTLPNAM